MKKLKTCLIFLIPILVLAVLTVLSTLSKRIPKNPMDTVGNTAGNLNNNGLFCEDEGRVYFANAYDGNTLYAMNPDETQIEKLSDAQVCYLNAAGNYLYYYQNASSASDHYSSLFRITGIYRAKKNGKDSSCLGRIQAASLLLSGNTLFYQSFSSKESGPVLCRIETDKTNKLELSGVFARPTAAGNGQIYFSGTQSDHFLYALDVNSNSISTLYEGDVYAPVISGDYVYYMDISANYRLCRYNLTTQTAEVLTQDRLDFFNVAGDMIYYQKSDSAEPALKRIRIDGTEEEVVVPGIYQNINTTSEYVYFNAYDAPTPVYHTPVYGSVSVSVFTAPEAAKAQ